MKSGIRYVVITSLTIAIGVLSVQLNSVAQVIDVLDETILLNNGAPTSENTNDAEDNFGGRAEFIIGNNNNNARGGLIRFDVASVADAINDASQVVTAATLVLNTADAREGAQPFTDTLFDVYAVVQENAGWFEGTQAGSRAGWSGEAGSASQLYLANPEFEPEDPLSPDVVGEFDDVRLWHSASLNDGMPVPFEVGIDTSDVSLGSASTEEIDENGFFQITLNPSAINSLLPLWLADEDENAGLYIFPTDGSGQWFFESNEGFDDEAIDLELTFGPGLDGTPGDFDNDGDLDKDDINSLIVQINTTKDVSFDVSGDGVVDRDDLAFWIKDLKNTWIGDSNLDGEFNSSDFVAVFTAAKYEDATPLNAGWDEGDWNGDQDFNSSDFVAAFTEGGYEKGQRPAAVPEPSSLAMLFGLVLVSVCRSRQTQSLFV